MNICTRCGATDEKLKLQACVACGRTVCTKCQGDDGSGYWNLGGKKGYACCDCLRNLNAFEGGALALPREFVARFQQVMVPELSGLVDAKLERVTKELVPPLIDGALERVESLTDETLEQAEASVGRLVGLLVEAIRSVRTDTLADSRVVLRELHSGMRRHLLLVAVVVGLVNLAGIVAAVFAAIFATRMMGT